jgi:hypothetical protein
MVPETTAEHAPFARRRSNCEAQAFQAETIGQGKPWFSRQTKRWQGFCLEKHHGRKSSHKSIEEC